jgi:carbon storage regulator CsrA
MLVLSRRAGEEILVPELGITLKVVAVYGKQVRIALSAPAKVRLYRGEVWRRIQATKADGLNGKATRSQSSSPARGSSHRHSHPKPED